MTRRHLIILLGIVAVLATATAAWAYWSATGSGISGASAGTLNAPASVTASTTAGSSNVHLAWSGSTLSTGQAPTGYYARRIRTSDSATAAACASSPSALTSATSCDDLAVPAGTYQYVITAVYQSWSAASGTSNTVTVVSDTAAPAITLTFPQDAASYNASGWNAGCAPVGFCGSASDPSGVATVALSVRQASTGLWWGGSAFNQATETFVAATGTTTWSLAFARPADGSYTVHVRASDTLGNTTPAGSYAAATFTTDTASPTLQALQLFDSSGNGKVDQVKATFSETLAASTATGPWTLNSVPSGGSLSAVSTAGAVATLTLNEGAGAANTAVGSFTVALAANAAGIRDAAGNQASFSSTAPADKATPVLLALQMLDIDSDGKVDRVTAQFTETLSSYSAGTGPWTLVGIPSGGTLSSVSVSSATATLTIAEGGGAQNTSVGSLTVALATAANGIRDAAANLSSFAATAPADGAGPVVTSITSSGGIRGRMESGDQLVVTFSEPLLASSVPATTTVRERDPNGSGNDELNITGITDGDLDTGTAGYITSNNSSASFASSTVTLSVNTITVGVAGACSGTCAVGTSQGDLSFTPATSLTDAAGNPAEGTFMTPSSFQLF